MLNIILLGMISFFTDVSTEMVYPLIPLYLTATFGATPALIGLIEGIAESLASLLKVFSGYVTDRFQHKRRLAFLGYSTSLFYKLALLLAGSWVGILSARVIDRIGKGIRTAPRDVLVSESSDQNHLGRAFGVHKALDMAGSALGILIAYFLVRSQSAEVGQAASYRQLFLVSIGPALIGLALFSFVREKKVHQPAKVREPLWQGFRKLDHQLKLYLLVTVIFTLGNSSNTFLLLRAKSVGFDDAQVILLYFLYNVTASLLAMPIGRQSDRIGRKRILIAGYLVFAVVYLGFALAPDTRTIIAAFGLYGVFTALTAGVERAYIAEIAPVELKGTMLGLQATLAGLALFPASLLAGLLWNLFGPVAPFAVGAVLSILAALVLLTWMKEKPVFLPERD